MVELRAVATDTDFEAWRRVRLAVLPNERAATVAEMRAQLEVEPDRVFLLALQDADVVGSGLVGRSSVGGAGVHPRVLPDRRRRGVGRVLLDALEEHARRQGYRDAVSLVEDDESHAWAVRRGYAEVQRQVEQVRELAPDEPAPPPRADVEVVSIADRPELLRDVFPVAEQGYADLATFRPVTVTLEEWLREEATIP
ncbi:MAG: GNAT family N-acetyltransferase, partial [Thermoleophilia bacterium]|nr:GNAT family N-acetyltransferase [Thermoleophilia bacterium]